MSDSEQRRSVRLACELPMQVLEPADWPPVTVLDLSRTGVRLGVGTDGLDLAHPATLGEVAQRMRDPLSTKLVVEFDPERLGSMLRRSLEIVRLGPQHRVGDILEIGCRISPPLTQFEVDALQVPLPPVGDVCPVLGTPPEPAGIRLGSLEGDTYRPAATSSSSAPTADRAPRLKASIIPHADGQPRPLRGRSVRLSPEGGVVHVQDPSGRIQAGEDGLVDQVIEFQRAYGSEVDLTLEAADRFLWYGPVRVVSVACVPELPGHYVIGFAFPRKLAERELAPLGLTRAPSVAPSPTGDPRSS